MNAESLCEASSGSWRGRVRSCCRCSPWSGGFILPDRSPRQPARAGASMEYTNREFTLRWMKLHMVSSASMRRGGDRCDDGFARRLLGQLGDCDLKPQENCRCEETEG